MTMNKLSDSCGGCVDWCLIPVLTWLANAAASGLVSLIAATEDSVPVNGGAWTNYSGSVMVLSLACWAGVPWCGGPSVVTDV